MDARVSFALAQMGAGHELTASELRALARWSLATVADHVAQIETAVSLSVERMGRAEQRLNLLEERSHPGSVERLDRAFSEIASVSRRIQNVNDRLSEMIGLHQGRLESIERSLGDAVDRIADLTSVDGSPPPATRRT